MTEARQADRYQMRMLGQSRPHRLGREQALRPRAQQEGIIAPIGYFLSYGMWNYLTTPFSTHLPRRRDR